MFQHRVIEKRAFVAKAPLAKAPLDLTVADSVHTASPLLPPAPGAVGPVVGMSSAARPHPHPAPTAVLLLSSGAAPAAWCGLQHRRPPAPAPPAPRSRGLPPRRPCEALWGPCKDGAARALAPGPVLVEVVGPVGPQLGVPAPPSRAQAGASVGRIRWPALGGLWVPLYCLGWRATPLRPPASRAPIP